MACECRNYEWLPRFFTAEHHPLCLKKTPPQNMEQLLSRIHEVFEPGKEGDSAAAATGEQFIKLAIGGEYQEGACYALDALYESAAVEFFYYGFLKYALKVTEGRVSGFKLYWRKRAELDSFELSEASRYQCMSDACGDTTGHSDYCKRFNITTRYQIRARLLISDKPEIEKVHGRGSAYMATVED